MAAGIMNALNTRRRLGGAVLLLAGVAVAVVVLWPGGDPKPAKTRTIPARIVSVPPLGIGFEHPTSWKRKVSKAVIGVRSPEGSVVVFFSSPLARPAIEEVRRGARKELLKQFAPAKIVKETDAPLGLRSVPSFELLGKDHGKAVRALEMVDATKYRTYAVTVVTSANPSRRRLKEARAIISTVRFGKPEAVPAKK
jgi:hypothetical protein